MDHPVEAEPSFVGAELSREGTRSKPVVDAKDSKELSDHKDQKDQQAEKPIWVPWYPGNQLTSTFDRKWFSMGPLMLHRDVFDMLLHVHFQEGLQCISASIEQGQDQAHVSWCVLKLESLKSHLKPILASSLYTHYDEHKHAGYILEAGSRVCFEQDPDPPQEYKYRVIYPISRLEWEDLLETMTKPDEA